MNILLLDQNFVTKKVIDVFEEFLWTDRYSAWGDFELFTPFDDGLASAAKQNDYFWNSDSDHVMILEEREIKTEAEGGNKLRLTGRSLESILHRRIVWTQTILSGNFQNAIKRLLDENVISPTITNRKIPNFIFEASTDPAITSLTVQAQFTGDDLYEAIKALCDSKNVGFKITLNSNNQFVFKLYYGVDRSYDQQLLPYVIFSPSFDNIINSSYLESEKALKNIALVAGEGEGAERRKVVVGTESSGLARRERFVDARDISSRTDTEPISDTAYNALLSQRGMEKLALDKAFLSFEGELETSQTFIYGVDFFLGDIIQVGNEYNIESKSRITEIIMSQNKEGTHTVPTFVTVD